MKIEEFKIECSKLGISLTDKQMNNLSKYKDLLQIWNKKFNLTTITEDDNIYLISDGCVPITNEEGTKKYVPTTVIPQEYQRYAFKLTEYSSYNGTADIDNNIASKWLKKYTDAGYTATNTGINGYGS